MGRTWSIHRLFAVLLLACGLSTCVPAAWGQYRLPSELSDPARPITISADESIAWTEGNVQILILRKNVTVEQGVLRATMPQGVVWLELGEAHKDNPVPVLVYGDGDVLVEHQGKTRRETKVLMELKTAEEIRLKDNKRKQELATNDPLFRTALVERQAILRVAKSDAEVRVG